MPFGNFIGAVIVATLFRSEKCIRTRRGLIIYVVIRDNFLRVVVVPSGSVMDASIYIRNRLTRMENI